MSLDSVWHLPFLGEIAKGRGNTEVCVIGVFGKSTWGHTSKSCIVNHLTKTYEFPPHEPCDNVDGEARSGSFKKYIPKVEAYYDEKSSIVYLHLVSMYDAATLASVCTVLQSKLDSHSASHDMWKNHEVGHIMGLVYLFSVCHLLLLVHPVSHFDISYDRLFQRVSSLRAKLVPVIKDVLKECNVGRDWWVNGRPCPPRLLFVFQRCHLLRVTSSKQADGDTKKKKPPVKRLQHTIEDQVYRILRSSRVLTNNAVNCLFSVPPNQAFVHIMTDEFKKIEKEEDPILGMLDLLRDSFSKHRDPSARTKASQLLTSPPTHWMEDYMTEEEQRKKETKEGGNSLRSFVFQHTSLVLEKKGFNDSIGRNPLPSHFELPTLKTWMKVANGLYRLLLSDGQDADSSKAEPTTPNEPATRPTEDMFSKVLNYRQYLRSKVDIEMKFSEARCSKVLPLAVAAYQNSLPSHYTSKVHNNQLTQALLTYNQHARGPATEKYRNQLKSECVAFWHSGRQLCEVRSLTDRHCVHRFHILALPSGIQDPDRDPPLLFHSSRSRSTATSSCGTVQGMRDDPFDLKEANYDFYVQLDKKAQGQPVDVYAFPVYQPGEELKGQQQGVYFTDGTASFSSQILSSENHPYETSSAGMQHNSASITTQDDDAEQQSGKLPAKNRSRHTSEGITESGTEDIDNAISTQGSADKQTTENSSQELSQSEQVDNAAASPRKSTSRSPNKERQASESEGSKAPAKKLPTSVNLSFALSFGGHSEGSTHAHSPMDHDSQAEDMDHINQQTAASQKPPVLKAQVKQEVNFIDGMIHSNCQKGVLPLYPCWSLVKIGTYSHYTPSRGLETPNFLPGTNFLIPWDIPVDRPKDDSAQWPVPGEAQVALNKKVTLQQGVKDQQKSLLGRRNKDENTTTRAFIGLEYETLRGQRFICSGPDKPVKVTSSGIVKDSCHKLLENDMPLYTQSPTSGRSGKILLGQLMRAYVVIPPDPGLEISLNPHVVPGPPGTPTFSTGVPDIPLSTDSVWVLRFPYVYVSDLGPHYVPKESAILQTCKLLKGMIKLNKK